MKSVVVGDFLVEQAPISGGRFVAFTVLAERADGSRASFREATEQQARRELEAALAPLELTWLSLQHEAEVFSAQPKEAVLADAVIVSVPGQAVAFTTADCLPIVLVSESAQLIAGIHAGWRSLAKGVIENCCKQFALLAGGRVPEDTQAWIGPSIAAADYEVDALTRAELLASASVSKGHFSPTVPGHYLADLPAMARAKLLAAGVAADNISTEAASTFTESRYHSARRDGQASGRMATVVAKCDRRTVPLSQKV